MLDSEASFYSTSHQEIMQNYIADNSGKMSTADEVGVGNILPNSGM